MLRPTTTMTAATLVFASAAIACIAAASPAASATTATTAIAAPDLDAFDVLAFDFADLTASSHPILDALQADGIIALKNIPGYEQLRAAYLLEATQCALAADRTGDAFLQHKTLNDGTQRFTISATAGKSLGHASSDTSARCPEYAAKYKAFSLLVETAVQALGKTLDATAFTISSHEALSGTELLSESVHLDHFHAYEAAPAATSSPSSAASESSLLSLDLHTDNGMLIAMAAPTYFDVLASTNVQPKTLATYESGLLIENRAGKLVRPVLKESELVFMVGAGFQEWIRSSPALRPVPHAMKYPQMLASSERLIRSWFGKMVLLTPETRMLNVGMSFGAFAAQTARFLTSAEDHDSGFAALACPSGRRLMENDKACVVKTCFPKPGKDPELACAIQCNTSPKSRPGADRLCEENCDCEVKPSNVSATYCWTLCSAQLPAGQCQGVGQRCKSGVEAPYIVDQGYVCNVTTANATATASNNAVGTAAPSTLPVPSASTALRAAQVSVALTALVLALAQ